MTISSSLLSQAALHPGTDTRIAAPRGKSLVSPAMDFLFLGGGSVLVFLPLLFLDVATFEPMVAGTVLFLAHFINSPHFAHSYQIFYQRFGAKAFGDTYRPQLRLRYIAAGIVVPLALIAFFAAAVAGGDARMLGFGFNIMLFLVGWHYVKQGYGMIIVDAVLKKNFFAERDKKILTYNAYLCWILSWLALNRAVAERDLFGFTAYSLPAPDFAMIAFSVATAIASILAGAVIYRSWRRPQPFPFNGAIAYLVTLYIWVLVPALLAPAAFVILMVLATPAAHSLQYLIVVWRYQFNAERATLAQRRPKSLFNKPATRLAYFFIFGVVISFCGFWIIPVALDRLVFYDRAVFGSQMFLFMFAIFINVHHYFLDNVMWRRENPDVARHLFDAA